jgi:hypothetical protein
LKSPLANALTPRGKTSFPEFGPEIHRHGTCILTWSRLRVEVAGLPMVPRALSIAWSRELAMDIIGGATGYATP